MRKIILILIVFICSNIINATEQVPDYLFYKNKKLVLNTGWAYPSPLQTYYYQNNIEYSFIVLSTANYRGHVAYWEIIDNKLFLKEIQIRDSLYKPEKYSVKSESGGLRPDGAVFADWFSGIIGCQQDKDSYYFHIRYGEIIDAQILSKKDYKKISKISEKDTANHVLIEKYRMLVLNQNYISFYFRLGSKEDTIVIKDKGGYLKSKSGYSPILEYFSNDPMKWPYNWENFEKSGAPNCKWDIIDNKVFVEEIRLFSGTSFFEIEQDSVGLESIFGDKVINNKVFADWMNGIYVIKHGTEKEKGVFPAYKEFTPTEYTYFRINNGIVTESYTIPSNFNFKNIPEDTDPGLKQILKEFK